MVYGSEHGALHLGAGDQRNAGAQHVQAERRIGVLGRSPSAAARDDVHQRRGELFGGNVARQGAPAGARRHMEGAKQCLLELVRIVLSLHQRRDLPVLEQGCCQPLPVGIVEQHPEAPLEVARPGLEHAFERLAHGAADQADEQEEHRQPDAHVDDM